MQVVRDECFPKAEFVLEEVVNFCGIKSGIAQESIWMKIQMGSEEVREDGF